MRNNPKSTHILAAQDLVVSSPDFGTPALMTVGEVAVRVRHLAKDPFALVERARHWGKLGLLVAIDRKGEGTGKHRLYAEDAVYDAAFLNALADAGIEPGKHRWLADAQSMARLALNKWQKGRAASLVLEIAFVPGGKMLMGTELPKSLKERARLLRVENPAEARAAMTIRVDLGMLFESVSKPAKPKEVEAPKRARAKVA